MKKIVCILLLIQGTFVMAQTETLVTINGKKVTINPNSLNTADNGLTAFGGNVQLGGSLTKPSVLTTTADFTLALKGLQAGSNTNDIVVVDENGVLKIIPRTNLGDNLGNHIATMDLDMSKKNISNIFNAYVKNDLQLFDKSSSNANYFGLYKNNGLFTIWNSFKNTAPFTIDETTDKTTLASLAISKGIDGTAPATGYIATAADASGNVVWKNPTSITELTGPQGIQGIAGNDGAKGETGAQGPQGIAGVAGEKGDKGETGATGPQGIAGNDGAKGETGAQGPQGIAGNDGAKGETGAQGPQGIVGNDGAKGETGAQGPQGIAGNDGAKGETGAQGPQGIAGNDGAKGETGAQGPQGIAGNDGAKGETGAQGPQGIAGNDGAKGETGAQGPQGIAGNDGAKGETGAQGPIGLTGAVGATGEQGPKGDTGPTGLTGAVGATGAQGPIGLTGAVGATGAQGPIGLNGAVGATGAQGPIGLTGAVGATGAQGPKGDKGDTGLTGAVGATGAQGPIGLTGAVGATGAQGPIGLTGAVGATGAQGPKGDIGPTGLTGAVGATGAQGPIGLTGAVGATGAQGPIGLTGAVGATGAQGPIGLNGAVGATGAQGPIGLTGAVGATGAQGPKGDKGDTGLTGAVGATGAQGPIGLTGAVGATGTQGPIGLTGAVGATGAQGPKGDIGPTGLTGAVGATGAQGPIGLAGAVGATGAQGPKGDKGDTGLTGAVGATGAQGPIGLTGAVGATGAQGPIGLTGLTGAVGATGAQGPIGLTGAVGATGAQGPKGDKGDTGLTGAVGATGAQGPIGLTGAVGATGAQGPKGDIGPTGLTGAVGATGAQGPIGLTGAAGATGAQGPIGLNGAVGATGAQGPKGDIGPTGLTGAVGATGAQGPIGLTGAVGATGATGPAGAAPTTGAGTMTGTNLITISNGANNSFKDTNISLTPGTANQVLQTVSGAPKWVDASTIGDNLGNHTATQDLNMSSKNITNINNAYIKNEVEILDRNAANTNYFSIYKNNGLYRLWSSKNSVDRFVIDENTGNTGIGTSSPKNKFSVSGGPLSQDDWSNGDKLLLLGMTGANKITEEGTMGNGYYAGAIADVNNSPLSVNSGYHGWYTAINGAWSRKMTLDTNGNLDFAGALKVGNLPAGLTSESILTADANGNVHKVDPSSLATSVTADNGLTAASNKVQLGGTLTKPTIIGASASNTLALTGLQTGAATDNVVVADGSGVLKTVSSASMAIEPWQVQGGTNKATANTDNIYQMGAVGIGTNNMLGSSNPNVKLAVNGSIITPTSYYADYVFEDYLDGKSDIKSSYAFKSLDEVEKFITENKHLPGVTSIKDLKRNEKGEYIFNMTDLSIQSLEKIEELYLHTIEQQKELEANKKEMKEMNDRISSLEKLIKDNIK